MTSIGVNLPSLGLAQLLLATIVFSSYAFALGELAGFCGRARAAIVGLVAAAGLVATGESWEVSVLILGAVPLIMGLFAFAAWTLWRITLGTTPPRTTLSCASSPRGSASASPPSRSPCGPRALARSPWCL